MRNQFFAGLAVILLSTNSAGPPAVPASPAPPPAAPRAVAAPPVPVMNSTVMQSTITDETATTTSSIWGPGGYPGRHGC